MHYHTAIIGTGWHLHCDVEHEAAVVGSVEGRADEQVLEADDGELRVAEESKRSRANDEDEG